MNAPIPQHEAARPASPHRDPLLGTPPEQAFGDITSFASEIGNAVNSINVSSSLLGERIRHSKGGKLSLVADLLQIHAADLPGFFATNPRAKLLPQYLSSLAEDLLTEQQALLAELECLRSHVDIIGEMVTLQQARAEVLGARAPHPPQP